MDSKIPLPRLPRLRVRLRSLLLAPPLLLILWIIGNEHWEYQVTQREVQLNATRTGESFAHLISTRLDNQYRDMSFLASLFDRLSMTQAPDGRLQAAINNFAKINPNLAHVNLISSDGLTRLWQARPSEKTPLLPPEEYSTIPGEPNWLLGQDFTSHADAPAVLTMRYRFFLNGEAYFISTPYLIHDLLAYHPTSALPYVFAVRDERDGSTVGVWRGGIVHEPSATAPSPTPLATIALSEQGYPFTVCVQSPTIEISALYWANARVRWLLYLSMLTLLIFISRALAEQMRRRAAALQQMEQLAKFNAMMAEANQVLGQPLSEAHLLETLCQLAVDRGGMALAFIAQPDDQGWLIARASAGKMGYLQELKLSIDPNRQEGRGTAGRAWQQGTVFFNDDFFSTQGLQHWAERARQFGFAASASLPIRKNGVLWGVFSVYHPQKHIFDETLRSAITQLAQQISLGLEWLDTRQQEQRTNHIQKTLLNNTLAGIAMVKDRQIVEANPRMAEMFGFANPAAMIGLPTRVLYADEDQYARIAALYPSVLANGSAQLADLMLRRQDGRILYADIAGSLIDDSTPDTTVWTLQDVTRRQTLQNELTELAQFQRTLFEANAAALFLTDQTGQFIDANPAFCQLTGYRCTDLVGKSAQLLIPDNTPPFVLRLDKIPTEAEALRHRLHRTQPIIHRDGRLLMVEVLGAALQIPNQGIGALWSLVDVTDLHDAQRAIVHQATHDALTGLFNRRALDAQLPKAIARARRRGTLLAVGMLDLDDFKPVNDTWGHPAGDALLIALAERLQQRLRTEDTLARLGGDEFVIVLEDLDPSRVHDQLAIALDRLYDAVRTPFDLGEGQQASIGMSLGIALFPMDGDEGDGLLRQADAALYLAKQNKYNRPQWWQLSQAEEHLQQPEHHSTLEAYGEATADYLRRHQATLASLAPNFVRQFYEHLAQEPAAQDILTTLTATQMQQLVITQTEHLLFLIAPETTREALLARSEHIGQVHSLVGVNSALLIRSISLYRRLLIEQLGRTALSTRDRYRLMMVIENRVEEDLLTQSQAGSRVIQAYYSALTRPLPHAGCLWNDALPDEIDALKSAPGIPAVLCVRRGDDTHRWVIEAAAGAAAEAFIHALSLDAAANPSDQQTAVLRYQQRLNESFAHRNPLTLCNERWVLPAEFDNLRIHSALFLPISDRNQLTTGVLVLLGTYPHQFESVWARQFARNAQLRISQIWQVCTGPQLILDHELAEFYRTQLFSGGLRVHAQPIIELSSGTVVKVEALARLALPDGTLLPPQAFIPLLGDHELDRLFQLMLDASLASLGEWSASGLTLDMSVNLPPTTLRDADCPRWVAERLSAHGISPERLTLELLENDMGDSLAQQENIRALQTLGTPLAMDDLGAGYSSLKRLASLPFSSIKIDQALFANLAGNPVQTLSLISAIIQMGRDFEQQVIVEGLEDDGAIEAARILGAGFGQGFGIARPMPIAEIPAWIQQHRLPPATPNQITTAAGALAYHWGFLHNSANPHHHTGAAVRCPLHAFLQAQGDSAEAALAWHAVIHENPDNTEVSRKLMSYLARLITQGQANPT